MIEIREIEHSIRKEASTVLYRVICFLVYYIMLILIGIGLFVAAFETTRLLLWLLGNLQEINLRFLIICGSLWLAMWWFCLQMAWYLVKPLFAIHRASDENRREIERADCPELFSVIEEIASKTGNKMPKHVYLSAEQNACVFYDSISIWSIFLPTRKNLMIGTGLLQGLNKDELKAILAHEFGHFSQHTMKVGSVTYRLLLIIREMIEFTQEEQQKTVLSQKKLFHIASGAMAFITGQTVKFYNNIEKKNRSLSRLMEFEADAVACKIAGTKPFVSSLCKLEILYSRYRVFEDVVTKLLREKRFLVDYEKGYEIVEHLMADDEKLFITYDTPLETLVSDEARFPSKITIIDGWNTHPSTAERIGNASQFMDVETNATYEDARQLVNTSLQSKIGLIGQRFICEQQEDPILWRGMKEMPIGEFQTWVIELFKNNRIPSFLCPFVDLVVPFDVPSEEDGTKIEESPFTKQNRDFLLEFKSALKDWRTLRDLSSGDIKSFLYDGSLYVDVSQPIEMHKQYLDALNEKLVGLEPSIYLYLCQQTEKKEDVLRIYWMIFYGGNSIDAMEEIHDLATAIKQEIAWFDENELDFRLNDEVKNDLTQRLWNFLRSFDYEKVNAVCGGWTYGEEKHVNELLQQCHSFASTECDYFIGGDALLEMIDGVYHLLVQLYHSGKSELADVMEQVVYHKNEVPV